MRLIMKFDRSRNGNDSGKRSLEKLTRSESPYRYEVRLAANRSAMEGLSSPLGALLKFDRPVKNKELSLKTGVYKVGGVGPMAKHSATDKGTGNGENKSELFIWNPTERAMLPVLGVALALGKISDLKDKILVFKPKRRYVRHILLDLTLPNEELWMGEKKKRKSRS